MEGVAGMGGEFWRYAANTFFVLAPVFLLGLFLSGLMRVLISRDRIVSLMGGGNLRSSAAAALIGIPVPLCSCSVLPVVSALRNKGASKPACASFLVTAPETGMDSIPVTYALLGPFMAVWRPVASFVSAIAASLMVIAFDNESQTAAANEEREDGCCGGMYEDDADYVGFSGLRSALSSALAGISRKTGLFRFRNTSDPFGQRTPSLREISRTVFRHAFVEQMDGMMYPLIFGVLAGGAIAAVFPNDISAYGVTGYVQYPVLLAAGIPVYICATATTPIAAALVLKGVSPGAALVFLLAGPATNTATIAVLGGQFGWRFTWLYVSSICIAAVAAGIALDLALAATGVSVAASAGGLMGGMAGAVQIAGLVAFVSIVIWRAFARRGVSSDRIG